MVTGFAFHAPSAQLLPSRLSVCEETVPVLEDAVPVSRLLALFPRSQSLVTCARFELKEKSWLCVLKHREILFYHGRESGAFQFGRLLYSATAGTSILLRVASGFG